MIDEVEEPLLGPGGRALHLAVYADADAVAGAEQSLATLLDALSPDIQVTIVGVAASVVAWLADARPGAATAVLEPVRDKRDVAPILAHLRFFARLRADILQANLQHSFACQYAIAAGLLTPGTRVIALEHYPSAPTARLQLALKRLASRRLAAHMAVSRRSGRMVESIVGYPKGYVHAAYGAVAAMPAEQRRRPAGPPRVVALGRFSEEKGFDLFLRALAELPDVHGLLIGDGPERARLEALVDELGLRGRVELPGWRTDAHELIATGDALVVPSRQEALGLSALEGMSWGLPVVAARVGGLAEVIADGETGLLVTPEDPAALADGISRALGEEGPALGANGLMLARRDFSPQAMARTFEDVYRKVLR